MLCLSRKVGEKVRIDGGIMITVSRVDGNRVSLGIEAPKEVRVVRDELPPKGMKKQQFVPLKGIGCVKKQDAA